MSIKVLSILASDIVSVFSKYCININIVRFFHQDIEPISGSLAGLTQILNCRVLHTLIYVVLFYGTKDYYLVTETVRTTKFTTSLSNQSLRSKCFQITDYNTFFKLNCSFVKR